MKNIYPRVWVDPSAPMVALGGVNGAVAVTLGGVLKEAPARKHVVAAEYVCGRLAMAAGLPGPVGEIVTIQDSNDKPTKAYLMLQMSNSAPPPVRGKAFVDVVPDIAARVVAFDCLVLNGDRHNQSISLPEDGGAFVYDYSEAFFGLKQLDIQAGHEYLISMEHGAFWGKPTLTEHLTDRAQLIAAIKRVQAIPDDLISESVQRTVVEGLLPTGVGQSLESVLHNRKSQLLEYFEGTPQPVFPKLQKDGEGQ